MIFEKLEYITEDVKFIAESKRLYLFTNKATTCYGLNIEEAVGLYNWLKFLVEEKEQ